MGKDVIAYQAGGFVTFVGSVSSYVNTRTGETRAEGPTPRLCAVSNSDGQWHLSTPFGNFSVPAQDEMVTTFKPAFLQGQGDVAGMQTLVPLGGSNGAMFTYTTITKSNGSVTRTGTVTRNTTETFTCELAEGGSAPAPAPSPAR